MSQIDRIYDTLIDEDELRICDATIKTIADALMPRPYSSHAFIRAMGDYLREHGCKTPDSIVWEAYLQDLPIFCPAFSDSSAGFGLVAHIQGRGRRPQVSLDSGLDFYELTQLKIGNQTTGLVIVGGGMPKNFAQDIVVAADILGHDPPMHRYAVQITVADVRDGALSGSTLKEASSWGKVDPAFEQMVYREATIALPLVAAYLYQKGAWKTRPARRWNRLLEAGDEGL